MTLERVELWPAFGWTCPKCEQRNFENAIYAELNAEERAELREEHGVNESQTGDWMRAPTEVVCSVCGTLYETDAAKGADE